MLILFLALPGCSLANSHTFLPIPVCMQIGEEKFLVVNEVAVELAAIGVRLLRTQTRATRPRVGNALFDCGLRLKEGIGHTPPPPPCPRLMSSPTRCISISLFSFKKIWNSFGILKKPLRGNTLDDL